MLEYVIGIEEKSRGESGSSGEVSRGDIWLSAVLKLVMGCMEKPPGSGSSISGVGSRGGSPRLAKKRALVSEGWLPVGLKSVKMDGMEKSPGSGSGSSGVVSRGNIWLSAVFG